VIVRLERSTIRPLRAADAPSIARYADNRKVWINLKDAFPHPYTQADARTFIRQARRDRSQKHFAIVIDGAVCGGIGYFVKQDVFRRTAVIGYWLGEPFWGRGVMTEAVRALTLWIFEHRAVCRIEAGVFGWNQASMRVLEKAGFRLEGIQRRAVSKAGRIVDRHVYALTLPPRNLR